MKLDKARQYVFRIGSTNQHRVFWDGQTWKYEFLAGGVVFDEMSATSEEDLEGAVGTHGLRLEQFVQDESGEAASYADQIKAKEARLKARDIPPCPKHGFASKNEDGTCEACSHPDYFDDHKGTEG